MAGQSARKRRQRGSVDALPSGAFRVRVYAGVDPVSKRRLDLTEVVPPGPRAAKEAEKVRTRLLNEVDEKRNPRSRATLGQLISKWLGVVDVDLSTRRGYESKIRKHIEPLLGDVRLTQLETEVLDSFYADLRRCRDHCDGKPYLQHRTTAPHECDEHSGDPCAPRDATKCRACRRACKPHICEGLGNSTVRQIHWIISGALDRGVTWKWLSVNPAAHADKPALPHPDPQPPTAEQAARLVERAWEIDEDWGAFIWTKMTIGARRGEMCGLRWQDLDLDNALIRIHRAVYVDENNVVQEKDTKTHQQRRIVLDPETADVLTELQRRTHERVGRLGQTLSWNGYVFSPDPDGNAPLLPDTASQRYRRMANRLGIDTTLKNLRHYSATELIHAGVDARIVAGRLGHGGGGATTLKVYTAWSAEADQRAAGTITGRMPPRPDARPTAEVREVDPREHVSPDDSDPLYRRIAVGLRGAIETGVLGPGDPLPSEKSLARRYSVANSTAHRAVALLVETGLVTITPGQGSTVSEAAAAAPLPRL